MRNIANNGEHTTRTVFGPNASYFTITPSGFSWQNLPPVLEHDIIGRMKKGLPTNVALGVHGAFVVLYGDGNVTFDVKNNYPDVDAMIRNSTENTRRKGIAFIALNPHAAGQYYVAYGDGSASWNLPNEWSADVTTVSKTLQPVGATRFASTLPPLGFAAAAGGAQSPASPTSSGPGLGTALHGAGKLWNVYQQQQQGQGSTPSFDPSTLAQAGGGFDPSSLMAGLDPTTLAANTIGVLFGN